MKSTLFLARAQQKLAGHSGFSVLEAVIGAAIVGLALMNITQIAAVAAKVQTTLTVASHVSEVTQRISGFLTEPTVCLMALGSGQQLASGNNLRIYDPAKKDQMGNPTLFVQNGSDFGKWRVSTLRLDSINILPSTATSANRVGIIRMEIEKGPGLMGGASKQSFNFPLYLWVDQGRIRGCGSQRPPEVALGIEIKHGWSQYLPSQANADGCYYPVFEGICPVGYTVATCLACVGPTCTPTFTSYDSNATMDGGHTTGVRPNISTMSWFLQRGMTVESSVPGGPLDKCKLVFRQCYNDAAKALDTYRTYHSQKSEYYRVAPLCIRK